MSRRVIITGGGTGGHIFPAISIGNALKQIDPSIEILFVGAKGGMEMNMVPQHGFEIKGVTISGIARSLSLKSILKNLSFPIKYLRSIQESKAIVNSFRPQVVVGVGGYASGPVGRIAGKQGIPLVLCEQNAYPGMVNKWLAPMASRILLGNEAASKYFEQHKAKLKVTGNPVRESLLKGDREAGLKMLGLDGTKPVVLSLGGSLGSGALNDAWEHSHKQLVDAGIQLVWQCGKRYFETLRPRVAENPNIKLMPFIQDMANAYAAADLIVSRAGGSTISELIMLNKPSILLPSPNVAEDHQTKNAMSLVDRGAALLVRDSEAKDTLAAKVIEVLTNKENLAALQSGIEKIEKHDSANEIAREVLALIK